MPLRIAAVVLAAYIRLVLVHSRQFVAGPRAIAVRDDWVHHEVAPGVVLSCCPSLPVEQANGRTLIGIAVETEPNRLAPRDALAESGEPETDTWTGRWILVGDGGVQLDAAGTLGCYYRRVGSELWLSSSPELLRELAPELGLPSTRLVYETGMDWYPPPGSGIDGLSRVLPSQTIGFDGSIRARRLLPAVGDVSYDDRLASLASRLRTALLGLADGGGPDFTPADRWTGLAPRARCRSGRRDSGRAVHARLPDDVEGRP